MAEMPHISVELSDDAIEKLTKLREDSKSTARTALTAVYAAIERQVEGFVDNGDTLKGLAALVSALAPYAANSGNTLTRWT